MFTKPGSTIARNAPGFRWRKPLIVGVTACIIWTAVAFGQNNNTQSSAQSGLATDLDSSEASPSPTGKSISAVVVPTPLPLQYETFFAWTIHLDEQAALHEKEGKDGSWLRNHLEESIGLTPPEVDLVRDAARRNQEETKAFNEKIVAAIMTARAKSPNNPPPVPPEVDQMEKQRDDATMRVVSDLEEKLGPGATAKLENWRLNHWARTGPTEQGPLPPGAAKASRDLNRKRYQETKKHYEEQNRKQQQKQQQQNGPEVQQ